MMLESESASDVSSNTDVLPTELVRQSYVERGLVTREGEERERSGLVVDNQEVRQGSGWLNQGQEQKRSESGRARGLLL